MRSDVAPNDATPLISRDALRKMGVCRFQDRHIVLPIPIEVLATNCNGKWAHGYTDRPELHQIIILHARQASIYSGKTASIDCAPGPRTADICPAYGIWNTKRNVGPPGADKNTNSTWRCDGMLHR